MNKSQLSSWGLALLAMVMIGFFSITQEQQKRQSKHATKAKTKDIFLPEFSLPDLYDKNKSLTNDDFKQKFTLLNIFASWCATCYAEHDVLLELQNKKIPIYAIAWQDIDENTIRYLEKNGNPYSRVASDNKGLSTNLLGIVGLPKTFLIDEKKEVLLIHSGNITSDVLEDIEKIVFENNN